MAKTKPLRKRHGVIPKKRLGQHFLKEKGVIDEIIRQARFPATERILEIGPGSGELTIPLSGTVKEILAVEKDPGLIKVLREKLTK